MIKNLMICLKCMASLDSLSRVTYYNICKFQVDGDVYAKDLETIGTHPILRRLERKRYIVTSECDIGFLRIKALGHKIYAINGIENHKFCAFADNHL